MFGTEIIKEVQLLAVKMYRVLRFSEREGAGQQHGKKEQGTKLSIN